MSDNTAEAKIHAVEPPAQPAPVQKEGLATVATPRTDAGVWKWLPFPTLEHLGCEVEARHTECKDYQMWRQKQIARVAGRTGRVDSMVWNALLPAAYAKFLTRGWRTPDGQGGWVEGIPWGAESGIIEPAVWKKKGRGATLETVRIELDVDERGYLRPTAANREKVYAAFGGVLDGIATLCADDEEFARPDEEEIRGN